MSRWGLGLELFRESVFVGVADRLRAVSCAGLGENVVDVCLYGRVADNESDGDFRV